MFPGFYLRFVTSFVWFGLLSGAFLCAPFFLIAGRFQFSRRYFGRANHQLWFKYITVVWILCLLYGEIGIHFVHVCSFPTDEQESLKIVVLGDPQIVDQHAYPELHPYILSLAEFFCDVQLRRSWKALRLLSRFDGVVVLGDLFWGPGYYTGKSAWDVAYNRLKNIFSDVDGTIFGKQRTLFKHVMSVAGNHDLGMYVCNKNVDLYGLWDTFVGPLYWAVDVPSVNVTLVGLSNPVLQDWICPESGEAKGEMLEFVESFEKSRRTILFTHIPLSSSPSREIGLCEDTGRQEGRPVTRGHGKNYENVLSSEMTQKILRNIGPDLVFSGDHHDLCKVKLQNGAYDITIPAFSWLEGTYFHGYVLLWISGGNEIESFVCYQPQQLLIYTFYAMFGIETLVLSIGIMVRDAKSDKMSFQKTVERISWNLMALITSVALTFSIFLIAF